MKIQFIYSVLLQPKPGVMNGPKRLRQNGFVSQLIQRGTLYNSVSYRLDTFRTL